MVTVEERKHGRLPEFTHYVTVSSPRAYPIKQVSAEWVGWRSGGSATNLATRGFGHAPVEPWADEQKGVLRIMGTRQLRASG
jgi:hypothetical protein